MPLKSATLSPCADLRGPRGNSEVFVSWTSKRILVVRPGLHDVSRLIFH